MATADFVAQAIERGVEKSNMPKGVFNMIYGNGVGEPLVKHPLIQAVVLPVHCVVVVLYVIWPQPVHNRFQSLLK
ncbi:NADP-dependent fatty aldehyde dehydrogenase domain protein [Acinetobacter baumannii 1031433]|nr:NADP-dependent fatty aldehyde dehydrogenase domain protein [Acinetobacter baumannii 1031433]